MRMGCGWLLGLMEYESSFNIMLLIRFKKYKYKSVGRVPSPSPLLLLAHIMRTDL